MGKTIVLAHGLFGFGSFLSPLPSVVHYFNGVADHLSKQGHKVIEPQVNPVGSIETRGTELANRISQSVPSGERVHIIAHSMGGLDARQALEHRGDIARQVATLVTIGTPHGGSPVADAIVNRSGPLAGRIPEFFRSKLEANAGALHDLTTDFCAEFERKTPDVQGVRYIEVAGDAAQGGHELVLFQLAAAIGGIMNKANDGVVTKKSALRAGHEHLKDWPVDHFGEIGWSLNPLKTMADHLARYQAIADML